MATVNPDVPAIDWSKVDLSGIDGPLEVGPPNVEADLIRRDEWVHHDIAIRGSSPFEFAEWDGMRDITRSRKDA